MKFRIAVPALVSCALPIKWRLPQEAAVASQKFTCPIVKGADPAVTSAASVTKAPEATDVTGPPPEVTASVVDVAAAVDGLPTVTTRGVLDTSDPEVPVIVAVAVPVAVLLAVKVSVLEPGEIGFAEKAAVTPLGSHVAVKLTLSLKPF
jgi:hypothetical protein